MTLPIVGAPSMFAGKWLVKVAPKKLWLLSGKGFNSLSKTKLAEDVPLRRNLIPTPGVMPGDSVKSVAPPILMNPVLFSPALKSPV